MSSRRLAYACFALLLACGQAAASGPLPEVYFTPFSHLDFFWGGTREECLARGNFIIARAVELAKRDARFRFLLEDEVFVANYADTHPGRELDELKRLVKDGRIEIAPKWAGIFQGLPDGEVQCRNLAIGKRYARAVFGVDPPVAHLGDLPDYTPQFPQMLREAGVPYMVMTRMGPRDKSLFHWKAPDGSTALVWSSLKGYGWGTFLSSKTVTLDQQRERLSKDLADIRATTPGPILMHWGVDLWAPPDDLVDRVDAVNKTGLARFVISTPGEFFHRIEKEPAIPELSGEIPSSWPNIVVSLPHLWPTIIPATNTLLSAEKFAAINYALGYAEYPQRDFDFLWKKLVESMDHNHDGQGGRVGDQRKAEYQQLALLRGGEILRDALRNIAERVQAPVSKSFPIVVFNPLGWTRDDVVKAHVALYGEVSPADLGDFRKGMRLLDSDGKPVPFHLAEYSENISRAVEVVFIARGVPSLGYRTYYLTAAAQPDTYEPASRLTLDADKDRRDPRRSLGADTIENEYYRVSVDRATGRIAIFDKELNREVAKDIEVVATEERGGNYIGIEPPSGRVIPSLINSVNIEENNAIRTVVRIEGQIAEIPITQRLTLYAGLKRIDLENTVDWRTRRFLRLEQLFPVAGAEAKYRYGVPFGSNAAENILPQSGTHKDDEIRDDSWRQSRHVQGWIHAGAGDWGVTLAADHQFVRLGDGVIRAQMLRGVRFTSVKVVRGDVVGSMDYPPAGTYTFHYSLVPGRGDWRQALAWRSGMALNNPLIPVSVADTLSQKSLPPVRSFCSLDSDNVVLSAVKKSDLDGSVLLRAYEIAGAPARTSVQFLGEKRSITEVNLLEEDTAATRRSDADFAPYKIKTLKVTAAR